MNQSQTNRTDYSIIIAVLSLIVSISAFGYTIWQGWKSDRENLTLRVDSNVGNVPIRLSSIDFNKNCQCINIPFNIFITNNSNKNMSLIEYKVFQLIGDGPIDKNKLYYSGIDGGLYNHSGTKVKIPFSISQGETKSYIGYVGVTVSKKTLNILEPYKDQILSKRTLNKIFGEKGLDIYGNAIEYKEYARGKFSLSPKELSSTPIFVFEWKSGKGNKFFTIGSDYLFPDY
ncbi:hypothetical protein [Desulfoluna spongiiphila]|uniref:hypothetical protein n=1 Tax=Desulfoluna spongiiphila TaxID=419481 RepID=UPI00125F4922|nr:hypothetical protein [Desulfoluna spongiiphila]